MNTPSLNVRIAAAFASMLIAVSLCSGVSRLAEPPVATSLLAQATTVTVR